MFRTQDYFHEWETCARNNMKEAVAAMQLAGQAWHVPKDSLGVVVDRGGFAWSMSLVRTDSGEKGWLPYEWVHAVD